MKRILLLLSIFVCQVSFGQMMAMHNSLATDDYNAARYMVAASITNVTEKDAVNLFAKDLKADGVWAQFSNGAIYPTLGGSLTSASYNLVNTANFQLSYNGTPTISGSNGVVWNGTTQYASTGLIPDNISMGYNNFTLAYYSGTSTAGVDANSQYYDMGSGNQAHGGYSLWTRRQANTAAVDAGNGDVSNRISVSNSDGSGMFIAAAVTSTGYLYRNNSQIASKSSLGSTNIIGAYSVFLGGFNEGNDAVVFYSNKEMRLAMIGTGSTTAQMATISIIANRFETKVGRNTY